MPELRVQQVTKQSHVIANNLACPMCQKGFILGDEIVFCPECKSPYHRDCWSFNGNQCAQLGCPGLGTIIDEIVVNVPGKKPPWGWVVASITVLALIGWWAFPRSDADTAFQATQTVIARREQSVFATQTALTLAPSVQSDHSPTFTPIPTATPTLAPTLAPPPPPTSRPTATPQPTITPTSPPSQAEIEDALQQAIWAFDQIKIEAVGKSYDDGQLATVLSGPALEEQQGSVRWLRTCNAYYEITPHSLSFESFNLLSPSYATVIVRKDESRIYYKDGQRRKTTSHDEYRISYDLQKIEDNWYIVSKGVIDEQTGFTPTPGPTASQINCG